MNLEPAMPHAKGAKDAKADPNSLRSGTLEARAVPARSAPAWRKPLELPALLSFFARCDRGPVALRCGLPASPLRPLRPLREAQLRIPR